MKLFDDTVRFIVYCSNLYTMLQQIESERVATIERHTVVPEHIVRQLHSADLRRLEILSNYDSVIVPRLERFRKYSPFLDQMMSYFDHHKITEPTPIPRLQITNSAPEFF